MAGVILAFLTAGVLLVMGRVFYLWVKERGATPNPEPIPLRYRLYAVVGIAAAAVFVYSTHWEYAGVATAIMVLVSSLLKALDDAFRWLRRDERPPGMEDLIDPTHRRGH